MISYLISLTLLAGAVMLLRAIFKKNVSSKVIYALWLAVVLRLCLPFDFILLDIPSLGKLDNVTMGTIQLQTAEESTPVLAETSPEYATPVQTGNTVPAPAPVIPDTPSVDTPHGDAVISPETIAGESTPSPAPSVPTPEVSTESVPEGRSISVGRILDLVWFGGAAAVFTVFARKHNIRHNVIHIYRNNVACIGNRNL